MIIWFTGQPKSGKTTLAGALSYYLTNKFNKEVHILDGDTIRFLNKNFDYSEAGRIKNILYAQKQADQLNKDSNYVLVSVVAPYKNMRETFKETNKVKEIYLYSNRKSDYFVENYEAPESNFLSLNTSEKNIEECLKSICLYCNIS